MTSSWMCPTYRHGEVNVCVGKLCRTPAVNGSAHILCSRHYHHKHQDHTGCVPVVQPVHHVIVITAISLEEFANRPDKTVEEKGNLLWCHDMVMLSALLALCAGNPAAPTGFPSSVCNKELWCFTISLNALLNKVSRCRCFDTQWRSWNYTVINCVWRGMCKKQICSL